MRPNSLKTQLPKNLRVVFFGASRFVIPILEVLRKNYNLSLVFTTERTGSDPVSKYCKNHAIPCMAIAQFNNETIEQLRRRSAPLAVLSYFGLILPKRVLSVFELGIINIHPSLLSKYRGPTPVQTAILNGDKKTGVTIIKLDEKVDHGPILTQVEEEILPFDTAETLYERLFKIGAKMLSQTINKYIKRQIKVTSQDHSKATFTKPLTRQDGYFDISSPPSPQLLDRMIKAYYPWPGAWSKFKLQNSNFKIVKFLPEQKIQVEGGKPMSLKDFLNGYPETKEWVQRLYQ